MMNQSKPKSLLARLLNRARDVLYIAPLRSIWLRRLRGRAMVYLYHRIGSIGDHDFLDSGGSPITSAAEFSRDLALLKKMGAEFICFSELSSCSFDANKFYVVISVDDGFACNYKTGMQIADKAGVPLTIFQCSGMLSSGTLIWEHLLYYLYFHPLYAVDFKKYLSNKKGWPTSVEQLRETIDAEQLDIYMQLFVDLYDGLGEEIANIAKQLYPAPEQIREAANKGHEIASHGHQHFKRSNISEQQFVAQLAQSRQCLEGMTGKSVAAFSFPFNSYEDSDRVLCARHYSMLATVDGGPVSPTTPMLNIPRNTFPGPAKNRLRQHRWLLTGRI